MVKFILISIFLFLMSFIGFAQDNSEWRLDTNNLKDIYIDQLDQLYYEYDDGHFISRTNNRSKVYYNDYGTISSIDIRNPQKILLFYKDFQYLIILDNTLSVILKIDVENISTGMISLAILSKQNDIWLFDEIKNALVRINNRGQILTETEPMYYYKSGFIPKTIQMVNHKVLLTNEDGDALLFDNFGQLIKEFSIPCKGKFHLSSLNYYCLEKNQLTIRHIRGQTEDRNFAYLTDTSGTIQIDHVLRFTSNARKLVHLNKEGDLQTVE